MSTEITQNSTNKKITRRRWTKKETVEAIKNHKVEGRSSAAVCNMLNKLGIKTGRRKKWTENEIHIIQMGGIPEGRSLEAVYQIRHKLHVTIPLNKNIDPKNPEQTALVFKAGRKNPPKHHHESVGELLLPIYTMFNGGMKALAIAKAINRSVEFVEAAITMKTEFDRK